MLLAWYRVSHKICNAYLNAHRVFHLAGSGVEEIVDANSLSDKLIQRLI